MSALKVRGHGACGWLRLCAFRHSDLREKMTTVGNLVKLEILAESYPRVVCAVGVLGLIHCLCQSYPARQERQLRIS